MRLFLTVSILVTFSACGSGTKSGKNCEPYSSHDVFGTTIFATECGWVAKSDEVSPGPMAAFRYADDDHEFIVLSDGGYQITDGSRQQFGVRGTELIWDHGTAKLR